MSSAYKSPKSARKSATYFQLYEETPEEKHYDTYLERRKALLSGNKRVSYVEQNKKMKEKSKNVKVKPYVKKSSSQNNFLKKPKSKSPSQVKNSQQAKLKNDQTKTIARNPPSVSPKYLKVPRVKSPSLQKSSKSLNLVEFR